MSRYAIYAAAMLAAGLATPLAAQQSIETVDPSQAIDGDLSENPGEPWIYDDRDPVPEPQPQTEQLSVANWTDLTPESEKLQKKLGTGSLP